MAKRIAVYGGSFNPPHLMHSLIARQLAAAEGPGAFDEVVVVPCGRRAKYDDPFADIDSRHRAAMCDLAFRDIPKVRVDLFDLEHGGEFTRAVDIQRRYAAGGDDVWHVIGGDLVEGGAHGKAEIQRVWQDGSRLWQELQYVVVERNGATLRTGDLPPRAVRHKTDHDNVIVDQSEYSSSHVRNALLHGRNYFDRKVDPLVLAYAKRYRLYQSGARHDAHVDQFVVRPYFTYDEQNPASVELAEKFASLAVPLERANCIVNFSGDGGMLDAMHRLWRRRLPFIGINTGHRGYLLNTQEAISTPAGPLGAMQFYSKAMLDVAIETADGRHVRDLAVNDAWVRNVSQNAWLDVQVDRATFKAVGDGLLVSTVLGSTGYAKSLGVSPLPVDMHNLAVAGMALSEPEGWNKSLLRQNASVTITSTGGDKRPIRGYVDGKDHGIVRSMRCHASLVASVQLAFSAKCDLAQRIYDDYLPRACTFGK